MSSDLDKRPGLKPEAAGANSAAGRADPSAQRRFRHEAWATAVAAGDSVLVLGSSDGTMELELAGKGYSVTSLIPDRDIREGVEQVLRGQPSSLGTRVRLFGDTPGRGAGVDLYDPIDFLAPRLLEQAGAPGGFDSLILAWILAAHYQPATLLQSALAMVRSGGTLIAMVPFADNAISERLRTFGVGEFADILRPHCAPTQITMLDGAIRLAGRVGKPAPDAWNSYGPEVLLRMSEQANARYLENLARRMEWYRHSLNRTRSSAAFVAGTALVEAAKRPSRAWRLPVDLVRLYRARRRAATGGAALSSVRGSKRSIPIFSTPAPQPPPQPVVAAILDPFSEFCFRYDAHLVGLTRKGWKAQLEETKPALLFVESAWHGNHGEWSYLVAGSGETGLESLGQLLEYCRRRNIPTVFWNKEDPPGFDEFAEAARRFDFIFTSDANSIPRYQELCGHDRVYALPFAAQPAIHNPRRDPSWPLYSVCFAGSWTGEEFPERGQELERLLAAALPFGLDIFDRNLAHGDPRLRFPERFEGVVKGSLSYPEMLAAYRCYRVMLNANSVTDSPTMFSRRVFESLACGTPVISTRSTGMESMLGEAIRTPRDQPAATRELETLLNDEEARRRLAHLGYRLVHTHHTYRHRLAEVFARVGLPSDGWGKRASVSVVIATCRPQNVAAALDSFRRQDYPDKELWLVLNNNRFDVEAIRNQAREIPNAHVLHMEGTVALGDCLNLAVERASGDYLSKMDDDDLYGEHYLSDSILAAQFSRAEITGKGTYFTFMEGLNRMARRTLRPEHDFTDIVSGATLTIRRDVFQTVRFRRMKRGTDTAFLEDAAAEGYRIYSADPFNFVLVRRADPADHTWRIGESEFLRMCQDVRNGLDLSRAMI